MAELRLEHWRIFVTHGFPAPPTYIPPGLLHEVREHADRTSSRCAMEDLVHAPPGATREALIERVLAGLESGRLDFHAVERTPAAFNASARATTELALQDLAEPEEELSPEYRIVIELVGENDEPIPSAAYVVVDGDGRTRKGRLDAAGRAELSGLRSNAPCAVSFPELDADAWEYVHASPL